MWAIYADELRRRRAAALASVLVCLALGVGLALLAGAGGGRAWAVWGLLGAICASMVNLALPLRALRRSALSGGSAAASRQPSVLARAATRRLWRSRAAPIAAGVLLGIGLYAAGAAAFRAVGRSPAARSETGSPDGRSAETAPLPPAQARPPQPPPSPEPTVTIGDHILVAAPDTDPE